MFRKLVAAAMLALAAGCQTAPQDDNALTIFIGDDGKMKIVSAGNSPEDQALAALMQSALDGEFDDADSDAEPLQEDEIWREDSAGNLTHIQSGAQCPVRWGAYVRGQTGIYRPDGMDIGCNYTAPDGTVMTFYVYMSDQELADELEATLDAVRTRQPVSTEQPFGRGAPSPAYVARALAYETADGTKMRTSVLLANGGAWRLKIRLTCTAEGAGQTETAAGIALIGQADRLNSPQPPVSADAPSRI
jgi:hypothetical protein